jgi:HD superfamily phosphodiesterase
LAVAGVLLPRPLYRARQVWHALRPSLEPQELALVDRDLAPQLRELFYRMERRDQRHALEVAARLQKSGQANPDLIAAALLHDCGKGAVPVWLRVAKVLAPSLVRAAARDVNAGWRSAAYRLVNHAEIGSRAAEAAGASSLTVDLIRGKVGPAAAGALALLTAADDAS